jgi:predicted RNA-binding protein with PUA-like domain
MRYWLFKSEPDVFSWDDLWAAPKRTTSWEGVRNYQARNLLRDDMKRGDGVLFYHSNAKPQVIMGTAKVVREGYPDSAQFDPSSKYYDPDAQPEAPRWFMVDIQAVRAFKRPLSLPELKAMPELEGLMLIQRGARLSVQPVSEAHWERLTQLGFKG